MTRSYWDALLASAPVNKQAAKVTSGSEHYEPNFVTNAMFWDERPRLLNLNAIKATQPQFIDLTGSKVGRMVVVGIFADDPPSKAKKSKGSLWVCRCVCGRYQGVRGSRIKSLRRDRCDYCYHVEDLRNGVTFPQPSSTPNT